MEESQYSKFSLIIAPQSQILLFSLHLGSTRCLSYLNGALLCFLMQWKKEMASQVGPPGYDPELDAKPKTKAVKRNERKKEKRLQVQYLSFYACSSDCLGFRQSLEEKN